MINAVFILILQTRGYYQIADRFRFFCAENQRLKALKKSPQTWEKNCGDKPEDMKKVRGIGQNEPSKYRWGRVYLTRKYLSRTEQNEFNLLVTFKSVYMGTIQETGFGYGNIL
jgi:hypothetical protein